jgi:predicted metal-binding protein
MMSNEEWERKMEFLLNQQARFDAEMYELKAAQAASEKRLDRISEILSSYATMLLENFKITDARFRELAESQKLTNEALRKLLNRFDRHLSEGHPGLEN